jgi:hypothetical protein
MHDFVDTVELGLRLGGLRAGLNQRGIELGELLLVHQPFAAGIDDVVFGLEIHHGPCGVGGLLAQFLDAILHPAAGPPRCLIFRLELIDDVRFGYRICDLRRSLRTVRSDVDVDDIGQAHALNRQLRLQPSYRPSNKTFF